MPRPRRQHAPQFERPRPFQVTRWGKFWSLEPLFEDERAWLMAQGGPPVNLGDVVLAVPAHGNRLRVTEVLGPSNDLRVVLTAMLHSHQVSHGFPEEVEEAARAVQGCAAAEDDGRVDLAGLPTFTIDPDTARDYDDAISVCREDGGYRAWVHIADVSYFVDTGDPVDLEARRRTASLYLPLWAEPMLPEELSAGVCSLQAGQPRKCVTVEFVFGADGGRGETKFYRSTICSDQRLTYGFVDHVLGEEPGPPPQLPGGDAAALAATPDLVAHLRLAQELAATLRRRRFARGALQIGSFEPEYRFDENGRLIGATSRPETASHALVEEFMLAANEAVAQYLLSKDAQALYRVHEAPDPHAVDALFATLEDLEVPTPPFPAAEKATPEQVTTALRRLSEQLPRFSEREHRGRLAFPQLLLRSLKQACYSPENLGHFGLASSAYVHFTSPIRRYPDLIVHRALLKHLGLGGGEFDDATLLAAADACSLMERTIAKLELKADDVALGFLLDERLQREGWDVAFEGEIIGLLGSGLFVHFDGTFEGYLPVRRLGEERYCESPLGSALEGSVTNRRFRLGDAVHVRVVRIDKVRGRVELELAGKAGEALERDRAAAPKGRQKAAARSARRRPGHSRHPGTRLHPPKGRH